MKTRTRTWAGTTSVALSATMLAALTLPWPTVAQDTQALAALLMEAEENNPEIVTARRISEAAAARVPQAGALPDPTLSVGLMNFPVADPSLGREMMTMTTVQLGEQFPWPGKRGLREDVAALSSAAALWDLERTRQRVLSEVKSDYYQLYFLDRALAVAERNETLLGDFALLTSTAYSVGSGTQPDVLRAQVERTRLTEQLVVLRERRTSTVAQLNARLSRPTQSPLGRVELPNELRVAALDQARAEAFVSNALVGVVPDAATVAVPGVPSVEELQRLALETNPMIQAHVQRVAAQQQALSLADKAALPDFNVTVGYSRRFDFGDFVNLMVSVPLPVFSGRKQGQAVLEQAAALAEHQSRHHALVNQVNAEIASLAAQLVRARDQLLLLTDGILPQAGATLESAAASYRVGDADFLTLLDAQVTLYRHELDYHRLLSDFATSVAALELAVGAEVIR